MSTEAFFALGLMVGLMVAVWVLTRKARRSKHYDEMQQKIRADGYRLGFFTTLLMMVVLIFLTELGISRYISPAFGLLTVMMVGVTVFALYCIRHEAFLSVGDKGKSYVMVFALVTVCNGAVALMRLLEGELLENGVVTLSSGAQLLMFAAFLPLLIALLIRQKQSGKEAEE